MIERVVRMTFREELTGDFLKLFMERREKIRNFPGCQHLELWKDPSDPRVYITFSKWEGQEFLDQYRKSKLFKETWTRTRALFEERPVAFSGVFVI